MSGIEIVALLLVFIYPALVLSAGAFLIYKNWKGHQDIRIEWDKVAQFLGFMALITMFRICFADMVEGIMPGFVDQKFVEIADKIGFATLPFVFWEDVYFGMPIAWLMKKVFPKYPKLAITLTIIISTIFATGHLYQGAIGMVTIIYPFFISYKYGKKYGFGTVMICHMLYDFFSVATAKVYHLLI